MSRAPVAPSRVLLVDGPRETRDVLEAVFQPRGIAVERVRASACRPDDSPAPPRVVVLHDETAVAATWSDVPRIVIGRTTVERDRGVAGERSELPQPFDYRDLVRAIETVLDDSTAA